MLAPIPLTHHQILALVQPFVRHGRAVDLAASDRLAQQLRFKPVAHPAGAEGKPAVVETLSLDPAPVDSRRAQPPLHRLRRTLRADNGQLGELEAEGSDLDELVERVLAVPTAAQFRQAAGIDIALSHRLPTQRDPGGAGAAHEHLVLRHATAQVAGLTLNMRVSGVSGYRAELELLRGAEGVRRLPDDLLAVLGRSWHRLDAVGRGWLSSITLRGDEPRRSREAEARLLRTVEHLATTLAEPPQRFHARFRRARWAVALQSLVPLGVCLAVLGFAAGMQGMGPGYDSMLGALANLAPPLLLVMLFMRPEMPRIGLPRIPLPPPDDAWQPVRPTAWTSDRASA